MNNHSKRWGGQNQEYDSIDLLSRKDQQIRRLQAELQQQKKKGNNAFKMIDSYRNISNHSQQSVEGLRNQVTRRIKAEQEVKKLRKRNEQLQRGIKEYIKILQKQFQQNLVTETEIA